MNNKIYVLIYGKSYIKKLLHSDWVVLTDQRIIFTGFSKSKSEDIEELDDYDLILLNKDIKSIRKGITFTVIAKNGKNINLLLDHGKLNLGKKKLNAK